MCIRDSGMTFIGSTFGDSKTIDDARLRSGIITVAMTAATIAIPGLGAAIAAPIISGINGGYIDPMEKGAQTYLTASNDNAFECGFQQRWKDKPGETLYYNPVYERADKHDDTASKFLCLTDEKEYEYDNCGKAFCNGDERDHMGFMCAKKCGSKPGYDTYWEKNPPFLSLIHI